MKHTLEPLLTVADLMVIFVVSQMTIYRWVALARQGKHPFPLPIGGHKQKLRWSKESILAYQSANTSQPVIIESASQRAKRHNGAMDRLAKKGVKVSPKSSEK